MPDVAVATTTRPCRCPRKCGQAACRTWKLPYRCTCSTAFQSAAVILWKAASRRMPALDTTPSIRPNASSAVPMTAAPPLSEATSSWLATASPPAATISATTPSAATDAAPVPSRAPPRSLTTTRAPAPASSKAYSRPRPFPAPVTAMTRPSTPAMSCAASPARVRNRSVAGEDRETPLDDRSEPLLGVARPGQLRDRARLFRQLCLHPPAQARPHQSFGRSLFAGGAGRDGARQGQRLVLQRGVGHHPGDQTDLQRLRGSEGGIRQEDLHGLPDADDLRQRDRRSCVGGHADPGGSGHEPSRLGGEDQVGGAHQTEAATTRGEPVDGGDHGCLQVEQALGAHLQPGRRLSQVVGQRRPLCGECLDVAAGTEVLALATEHERAQRGLPVRRHHRLVQRPQERHVHTVGRLRSVEAQVADAVVVEVQQHRTVSDEPHLVPRPLLVEAVKRSMPAPALSPSRWASVASTSIASPSRSVPRRPARTRCLIPASAAESLAARAAASSSTAVSNVDAGTAR